MLGIKSRVAHLVIFVLTGNSCVCVCVCVCVYIYKCSNCTSYSAVFHSWLGLLLSVTEVFSCCLSKKVVCTCAYAVVVQIFVSFILQCKFVCKLQDDLVQGFIRCQKKMGASSLYQVSVGWREVCYVLMTHKYYVPLCKMKPPGQLYLGH